ncbi:hypothetical protein AAG906_039750 [Vitis piasezkii]
MGLPSCLGSSTFQTLKLTTIPIPFKPLVSRTLTLNLLLYRHNCSQRPPFPFQARARAPSAPDVQASPVANSNDKVVKPQWKAAINFKWIRDNKAVVANNIKNRNSNANLELILELYERVSNLQKEVERLRGERNIVASKMKGKMEPSERQKLIEEGKNLKEGVMNLEEDLLRLTDELQQEAQCIPNMTHPDVPIGGEDYLFDFDAAAEVSGSKFYYLKNEAVMLEMALINWTLSEVMKRGFTPLTTPEIVRSSVVEKCGFQPRGSNTQVYSIEGSDQCLIGTAEIPVGGIHMDSILAESLLPLKYVAFSHCFRTEAGAAGTATRGLYRVHQFSKVEMFIICQPEDSNSYHEELIGIEEDLFSSLGLHFKFRLISMSRG